MKDFNKEILITGFALFALFFGAGNLLLPPLLGYKAGGAWPLVLLGFVITAVVIPILGIFAHARLQGTMYDFAKKVSPTFSIIYCVLIYIISVTIPSPRTASATHEMTIYPVFESHSLLTSVIYFSLVLLCVLNRSKIVDLIGKYLTPLIVIILIIVIGKGLFSQNIGLSPGALKVPLIDGMLEGYQTFDAIGAVLVGGVIIVSINIRSERSSKERYQIIWRSGIIAGIGLLIMYTGLITVGAYYGNEIVIDSALSNDMQRARLLQGISKSALGNIGNSFLSVLIALACFTTAVGIVAGTSDYFKGLFKNSQKVFVITASISCLIGVLIGQLDFHTIIVIALPILMIVYPITIALIFLNVLPDKYASKIVFRWTILAVILFSIPDFLKFVIPKETLDPFYNNIPLADYNLGWLAPMVLTFIISNLFVKITNSNQ